MPSLLQQLKATPGRPMVAVAALVAAWRLWYCTLMPTQSDDVARHLYAALQVRQGGLAGLAQPIRDWDPRLTELVPWSSLPYNYPVVAIAFFQLISWLWPTIFFIKLLLTLLEAANSLLLWRVTGDRWLALLYWSLPTSICWVSHEGQFEPLQNLFVILAFALARRASPWAFPILAIAIQTKISAVFMAPWLVWTACGWPRERFLRATALGCVACLPTLLAVPFYPAISNVYFAKMHMAFNPYHFDVWAKDMRWWGPDALIVAEQIASYLYLGGLAVAVVQARDRIAFIAPVVFLIVLKTGSHFLWWYFLLLPTFLLPVENARHRRWLVAGIVLLDVKSLLYIALNLWGRWPLGYCFTGVEVSAFTPFPLAL